MSTIRVSATAARNRFFELLNQVAMGTQVIIERDAKEVAVMSPKKQKINWVEFRKASEAVRGIWKDYDEKDNPLRRPGAWPTMGKWDKGLKFKK
ncbi:type II toxin-antitoxin system prevent-host-death family antitoxin [Candidatus Daviesbacteria bacterium]|nr:type II toxin-antitoxin system prevent-host-death family antitoxin [Candidatus Daviesbacteria bacterium]